VPQTLATVLGVREDASRPLLTVLTEVLHLKRLLVLFDNCEHLIEACAQVAAALLRACPHVAVLATSREALGITGETAYRVPSLSLPAAQALTLETLHESEAVRLFGERATAVQPHFALTPANAAAVAQVCQRLDGIPLALEMAAARVRGLSVEQLAARLDQRFRLLTGGSRAALPRQQTLRATVDWSYELLSAAEQTLFSRLSVFAGGWTLEAAEAICAGGSVAAEDVLDLLLRLVDKSLVVAEDGAERGMRYRLLETLRQYGRERLVASGEAALIHRRHAAYYMALAECAEPEIHGPAQGPWLDDLEREYSNLRTALAWCLDYTERLLPDERAPEMETGMRLATALHFFWWLRQHLREGQDWLERALARGRAAPAALRAKTLLVTGDVAGELGDPARAQTLIEQSVALYRELGSKKELAVALSILGTWTWRGRSEQRGVAWLEEGVAVAREGGDPWTIAWTLFWITHRVATSATIQHQEERSRARAAGEESLALFQALGDTKSIAWTQQQLGLIALYEGDHRRARAAFSAELAPLRALGDSVGLSVALASLADVAREQGDTAAAAALYEESLALCRDLGSMGFIVTHMAGVLYHLGEIALDQGDWVLAQTHLAASVRAALHWGKEAEWWIADALEGYGALAAVQGAPRRALRLAGAAAALRERERGTRPLSPREQVTRDRRLAPARHALSAEEQAAAWAEGQTLPLEQAIAEALGEDVAVESDPLGTCPTRQ
jgi:non-specific serine/threonine protein kinase